MASGKDGKEGSKRNAFIVLVLILIMVGSSIGFVLLQESGKNKDTGNDASAEPEAPTLINFSAEGIDATVVTVFNGLTVYAYTDYELKQADDAIYSVEGVRKVGSSWSPGGENGLGTPIYTAQVYFENGYTLSGISEKIRALPAFSYAEIIGQGIVEVPQTIRIRNNDLNIEKNQTLSDAMVNAQISGVTQEGDRIKVAINLALAGLKETNVTAMETENPSAAPKQHSLKGVYEISSFEPELSVSGKLGISKASGIDAVSLARDINSLENISDAATSLSEFPPNFTVSLDGNYTGFENDLNSALSGIPGITGVLIEGNSVKIGYDVNSDFAAIRLAVENALTSKSLNSFSITEPSKNLSGKILLTRGSDYTAASKGISGFLEGKSFFEVKLVQKAIFLADSLTDADINISYSVKDGNFTGEIKAGRLVGDKIPLNITYFTVRDKVEYVFAEDG